MHAVISPSSGCTVLDGTVATQTVMLIGGIVCKIAVVPRRGGETDRRRRNPRTCAGRVDYWTWCVGNTKRMAVTKPFSAETRDIADAHACRSLAATPAGSTLRQLDHSDTGDHHHRGRLQRLTVHASSVAARSISRGRHGSAGHSSRGGVKCHRRHARRLVDLVSSLA